MGFFPATYEKIGTNIFNIIQWLFTCIHSINDLKTKMKYQSFSGRQIYVIGFRISGNEFTITRVSN